MKWEPVAAMAAVFLLGLWLVLGPVDAIYHMETREGATTRRLLIAGSRGVLETLRDPTTGEHTFRVIFRDGWASPVLSADEFRRVYGDTVHASAIGRGENWLFKALNITTWTSLIWVAVGLGGQLAFSGRMLIQWMISEKSRRSVVPALFWWLSLVGGLMLFAYFAWRQDLVGVMGQSTGIVIYARNIRLIFKQRRREARERNAAAATPPG
ncbi:MAG: lipid-A-disaccharide synthase N-terminal domain-containing protein [Phycisphaerales bacterium]